MLVPHPYRTPEPYVDAPQPEAVDLLRATRYATLFVVGWSLLRVAVCSVRGLDAEGCFAAVVLTACVSSSVCAWSRRS
jgi:hypothetical protein